MKFPFLFKALYRLSRNARFWIVVFGVCSSVWLIGCGAAKPEPRDNAPAATSDRIQAGPANKVRANFRNVDPE